MKKNKIIQHLSIAQWRALWSAYWRLWPMVLRIKFKQFSKDTSWITKNITLVNAEASNPSDSNSLHNISARDGLNEFSTEHEPDKQLELAKQLHESVRLAARLHFLPAHCLPRSLVLASMLEARNIEAHVYIGVSKKENGFASHAWIEVCKQMIAEPEAVERDFTRLQN